MYVISSFSEYFPYASAKTRFAAWCSERIGV